ncbi:riboflavin biosynthesis protein RibD [Thermaurantimonas aggregans]|uniref:Riboflavin biosynthesis protein RibD n=1 Tax=Thermaurantimonas aggregans TaxID=2173829 RepID=A0A401XNT6_9FLAO|nr:bifunctional diaminohydroxyphosphoribosylaminopyrimidine deaminase/5-amino-6-(5-phosphoribosylamino)uracil reductase RibD [Thermaurantimonas aggregans]MCX8149478.1 bifunctional diaminohydroxyphosphoribosylaminopyrimidine deaminase/5-amino-6-(5-phosphoribosylamino)uracil reductase RibD [Thermaurantimonas aggregans]GCD78652.1 riboflavin biosynthesis protein RibD [Thermaurantimonas aggregans]
MEEHSIYMHRCFQLALHGSFTARPNPMVGAVIVHNGKIIGEGWHRQPGEPHAEVMAVRSVKDESLLTKSTLYVNLEPCSHYGRTPPCSLLILEKKIPKVVVSNLDPNPIVAGSGIRMLQSHGVEVITGVEEQKGWEVNRHFFTFHTKKRPYIHLKWAESADGLVAPVKKESTHPFVISSPQSLRLTHQLRASLQAILIGSATALSDDPSLTTRLVAGPDPQKFVIDRYRKLPDNLRIFTSSDPALRIVDENFALSGDIAVKMDSDWLWLNDLLKILYTKNIQSLQVEGGTKVLNSFIRQGLWDEAWLIKSPNPLTAGVSGPSKDSLWNYYRSNFTSGRDTVFIFKK